MTVWLMLSPREVEMVSRPIRGEGDHAELLRTIRAKLNTFTGDLTLTGAEWVRVQSAIKHWQLGGEMQFKALLAAYTRSPTY